MAAPNQTYQSIRHLMSILLDDVAGNKLLVQMVTSLVSSLGDRIQAFRTPEGYAPQNIGELTLLLDVLFAESLHELSATSIHSSHPTLKSYKGYWEDPELGELFKCKNEEFLARGGRVHRIFLCDALADAVVEDWFTEAVIPQLRAGAQVRVIEITGEHAEYEDFGIYDHLGESNFLLLAPRDRNLRDGELRTVITTEYETVRGYTNTFVSVWERGPEPLRLINRGIEATGAPQSYGTSTVNDLVGCKVVLRNMRRLDTGERILPSELVVRKYEREYARALLTHIQSAFEGITRLLYVGDAYRNDGRLIRNLGSLYKNGSVTGFICEPALELPGVWFNGILYTDRWTDLTYFAADVCDTIGPETLAIIDIDQTMWAAKGACDGTLASIRSDALADVIARYFEDDADPLVVRQTLVRARKLHATLGGLTYHESLTLDNEDFRAGIAAFAALGLLQGGGDDLEDASGEQRRRLTSMSPDAFVEFVARECLPSSEQGWQNASDFVGRAMAVAASEAFQDYATTSGLRAALIQQEVSEMFTAMHDRNFAVQFAPFRVAELAQSLLRTDPARKVEDQLVLNKTVWDFGSWLREHGVPLLAVSDRPEEGTHAGSGASLLDRNLTVYGSAIDQTLRGLPVAE
jgi:hypothetical protein